MAYPGTAPGLQNHSYPAGASQAPCKRTRPALPRPAQHVRYNNVEGYGCGKKLARQGQGLCAIPSRQDLESCIVGQVAQDLGIMWVVFDDQQGGIVREQTVAVVGDALNLGCR